MPLPSIRTRLIMTAILLGLWSALAGYLVLYGNPENSLHQSALAWAFTCSVVLSGGYLLGEAFNWNVGGTSVPN